MITEQGIKSALDCDLSLISRLLKKNEKKGYIYRTLLKVANKKRKQNAFFLTEEGIKIANELSKIIFISDFKIEKEEIINQPKHIKICEIF